MRSTESHDYVPPTRIERTLVCRYQIADDGDYELNRYGERIAELASVPIGSASYNPQHEHGSRPLYDYRPEKFAHCPPRAPSSANLDRYTEAGNEHDRRLDEIIRARPRQLSAEEVGTRVQALLKKGKSIGRRDAIYDFLLRALAYTLFGAWPSDPSEVAAQRAAMRDCAAFGSLREMLQVLAAGSPELGRGTISYRVAESAGRTTAGWNEIKCQPSHTGGSTARGEESVDRYLDAQSAIRKAKLSGLEHEMLEAWLLDPPKNEDGRINWPTLLTQWRLMMWRSAGGRLEGIIEKLAPIFKATNHDRAIRAASEATKETSDRALKASMTRLRARVETSLSDPGVLPQRVAVGMVEPIVARPLLRYRPPPTHTPARTFMQQRFGAQNSFSLGSF
jgi:hypothetical protein